LGEQRLAIIGRHNIFVELLSEQGKPKGPGSTTVKGTGLAGDAKLAIETSSGAFPSSVARIRRSLVGAFIPGKRTKYRSLHLREELSTLESNTRRSTRLCPHSRRRGRLDRAGDCIRGGGFKHGYMNTGGLAEGCLESRTGAEWVPGWRDL